MPAGHAHLPLASQVDVVQSAAAPHFWLGAHFGSQPAPQSRSLSVPFCTPSVHVAAWQTLEVHTWLSQSPGAVQGAPAPHFVAQEPPQSTPTSSPFWIVSVHDAATHAPMSQ
jgi:hypothetical protein